MATKKVYFNTIAQLAGKLSTAFISIFLIKILTVYLSIDNYGLYSKVYNYLSIFATLADLGLYTITIREISKYKSDSLMVQKIIGNMMTVRSILGIFVIALSLVIAYFLPGYNSELAMYAIFFAGIFTFFGLINSAVMSLLQAYLKTGFSFVSNTVGKIANFVSVLFVVFYLYPKTFLISNPSYEFNAFLWIMGAGIIGNAVMTALIYMYSSKIEKIRFHFDKDIIKNIVTMSIPYGMALFLNIVYFKVDVILLSILENQNVSDVNIALYSVPLKIVEVGMMFGTLFLQSMLPLFSEKIFKNKMSELGELVNKSYKVLFTFGTGIVSFSLVCGYEILRLVSSTDYLDHIKYQYNSLDAYRITVFIFLFYFISSIFTYILVANNEQSKLLKINFFITILNIVGNIILIPKYSFIGSAISTLVSQIALLIFTFLRTRHIYKFNFLPVYSLGVLFFGFLGALVSFYLRNYMYSIGYNFIIILFVCAVIFSIIYLSLSFLLFKKTYIQK